MPALVVSIGNDLEELHTDILKMYAEILELRKEVLSMAISQADFDTDLAALVASVGALNSAVDAWMAAHPDVDLTAEDQAVRDATAAVQAELDKINPSVPTPEPAPTETPADQSGGETQSPPPDAEPVQ